MATVKEWLSRNNSPQPADTHPIIAGIVEFCLLNKWDIQLFLHKGVQEWKHNRSMIIGVYDSRGRYYLLTTAWWDKTLATITITSALHTASIELATPDCFDKLLGFVRQAEQDLPLPPGVALANAAY